MNQRFIMVKQSVDFDVYYIFLSKQIRLLVARSPLFWVPMDKSGVFLEHESRFGGMPVPRPPVTQVDNSGNGAQVGQLRVHHHNH